MLPSAPPVLLGSAPIFGFPVFTTIYWKGVSFPLGMAIVLISLLWPILRSSHLRWPPLRLRYGPRTRRGKLVRLRRHLWWTSLLQILLRPISPPRTVLLWALLLARVCARSGRCSPAFLFCCLSERFYCSRYFLDSTGHFIARALSLTLSYEEAPGPSATEGRCFIRGDWRSTWFAERQVCSVHSVPLFNNISPVSVL